MRLGGKQLQLHEHRVRVRTARAPGGGAAAFEMFYSCGSTRVSYTSQRACAPFRWAVI
jgi:hypothetical protein